MEDEGGTNAILATTKKCCELAFTTKISEGEERDLLVST